MSDLTAPARYPVARKRYRCEQCQCAIEIGEKHLARPYKDGGKVYTYRAHQDCEWAAYMVMDGTGYIGDEMLLLHESADKKSDGPYLMQLYPAVYSRLFVRNK